MTTGDPADSGRHGDLGLKIGQKGMGPIATFLDEVYRDDVPVFLWYALFLPHTPHNPPDSLYQKYKKQTPSESLARYWVMCERIDQTISQLMDVLDSRQLTKIRWMFMSATMAGYRKRMETDLPGLPSNPLMIWVSESP